MSSKVIVLTCLLAVLTAGASADIISSYDSDLDKWTYTVSGWPEGTRQFWVYLDPNMDFDYLANITNDSGDWTNPTSLQTYVWTIPDPDVNLYYLQWVTGVEPLGTVTFSFADAHDTTVNAPHMMDLVNHPGPLLYDPPSHALAPSASLHNLTGGLLGSREAGHDVAIVPEPSTLGILGLGLLGLVGAVRRRRRAT